MKNLQEEIFQQSFSKEHADFLHRSTKQAGTITKTHLKSRQEKLCRLQEGLIKQKQRQQWQCSTTENTSHRQKKVAQLVRSQREVSYLEMNVQCLTHTPVRGWK